MHRQNRSTIDPARSDDLHKGKLKVVYTGDADDQDPIARHVRRPSSNKAIQRRMKDPADEIELVIVQSMWLTGFDSPPLHTLYLDRPMRGADAGSGPSKPNVSQ